MKPRVPPRLAIALGAVACVAAIAIRAASDPAGAASPLAPGFHRGVNHAHVHERGHGYGAPVSARSLATLRTLGFDSVALTVFAYQRHADDPDLLAPAPDPSLGPDELVREIRAARGLGLSVVLKPHVWSHDFWDGDEWHGTIRQRGRAEHARWWRAYRRLVVDQAQLALAEDAEALCLGTELVRMTRDHEDEWRALIAEIRALAAGGARPLTLTYAAHWQDELTELPFWDALDVIGVSAYFPLDAPAGASVEALVSAWAPHVARLAALHDRYDKPIWFLEAGYRTVEGTHREPWRTQGGARDVPAQARAYAAMFRALAPMPWWQGVYLWKSFTDPDHASERDDGTGYRFMEEPTASVLRRSFGAVDSPS